MICRIVILAKEVHVTVRRKQPADRDLEQERHEPERMVLVGADKEAFLEALLNPPEPTERLVAAMRRHRDEVSAVSSAI